MWKEAGFCFVFHTFLCMKLQMTFAILIWSVCVIDGKYIDKLPVSVGLFSLFNLKSWNSAS